MLSQWERNGRHQYENKKKETTRNKIPMLPNAQALVEILVSKLQLPNIVGMKVPKAKMAILL
jgi:hypothetical protein